MTTTRGENRLISLVAMEKPVRHSIAQAVRDDLELITKARAKRFSWKEISDALGFPGKESLIRGSYAKEINLAKKADQK